MVYFIIKQWIDIACEVLLVDESAYLIAIYCTDFDKARCHISCSKMDDALVTHLLRVIVSKCGELLQRVWSIAIHVLADISKPLDAAFIYY